MSRVVRAPLQDLHISHGLTYVSLVCGLGALGAAARPEGGHAAGACLALAALADTFDGRFARQFTRTARQQATGGALDSLVDACVFGITPVAVLAMVAPPAAGWWTALWWTAAFAYVLAAITRLAFFNVEDDRERFVGVPTPAIALVWSSVLLVTPSAAAVPATFAATAFVMVAPIAIPRPRPAVLALFAAWAVSLIALHGLGG